MEKDIHTLNVSEAREKLTQLERMLKPGETLQVTKRGKAFARIALERDLDPYEEVLNLIESLPDTKEDQEHVAANYKQFLYGMNDEYAERI